MRCVTPARLPVDLTGFQILGSTSCETDNLMIPIALANLDLRH
jgi:hypothetical protein